MESSKLMMVHSYNKVIWSNKRKWGIYLYTDIERSLIHILSWKASYRIVYMVYHLLYKKWEIHVAKRTILEVWTKKLINN